MNEHAPVRVGFAMTGSFCTFSQVIDQMEQMAQQTGWQLYPILSPNAYETDTRFGSAQQFRRRIEEICGREIWHTLTQTEPIGPKKLLDVLLVAPCVGHCPLHRQHPGQAGKRHHRHQRHPCRQSPPAKRTSGGAGGIHQRCPCQRREKHRFAAQQQKHLLCPDAAGCTRAKALLDCC